MMSSGHQAKYPVQTLEKSLNVLLFLKENANQGGLSIAEISDGMGMPKSGIHRILDTFMEYDFVEQNPRDQNYRLGWGLYHAGKGIPQQYSITNVDYLPTMQLICDRLMETVNIGIAKERDVVVVCTIEPNRRLRPTVEIGEREPFYATALGKVFMSCWTDEEIRNFMALESITGLTKNTITDVDKMLAEIDRVRAQGYGMDCEEFCDGMTCFAVPIRDYTGKTVAALSVSSISARIDAAYIEKILAELRSGSTILSHMLGYKL